MYMYISLSHPYIKRGREREAGRDRERKEETESASLFVSIYIHSVFSTPIFLDLRRIFWRVYFT